MTNIAVTGTSYQVEKRSWLLGPHGTEPGTTPSVTLDVSAFTAATHYPNGYIMSGIILGKITATGLYAPYVDAAVDGTGTAAGILFSSVKVPNLADLTINVGAAMLVHGFVSETKLLSIVANAAAGGGFIDTAGKTNLSLIHFAV